MKVLYMHAIPETLVSVLRTGKMPENYLERTIDLYQEVGNCIQSSSPVVQPVFLIEILVPENSDIKFKFFYEEESLVKIQAQQIKSIWITHVYAYDKAGYDLAKECIKLNENGIPVSVKKEFFRENNKIDSDKKDCPIEANIPVTFPVTFMEKGSLLDSKMQTLVNTVNCVGVMGKGIAKEFKARFPLMFVDYKEKCKSGEVVIGKPYLFKDEHNLIINFPTKKHWRNSSCLEDIEEGLKWLVQHLKEWGVTSIAIPPLGCGNGGLDWKEVKPLILKYLGDVGIPIEIYPPLISVKQENRTKKRKREDCSSKQAKLTDLFYHPKDTSLDTTKDSPNEQNIGMNSENSKGI
ncbi:MAG: Appr-p processing domain protein [Gammaproteobacteria bacterium]|jgi:O-acetyl-ADP-ribose deacetylase (regulator of RNase III)|nr:Appr-p processing domain protein [Gammaproteobacteria bacterium]